jgi:DNA modification methylase
MNSKRFGKRPRRDNGITWEAARRATARLRRQRAMAEVEAHEPPPRNDFLGRVPVEMWPVDRLKPPQRNVRQSNEAQAARIGTSLNENGLILPILVDQDGNIIDGVTRWRVARQLGLAQVPVLVVKHLSPAKLRKLRITLNRLGELGDWNLDALKLELEDLIDLSEDVVTTGFAESEVDTILFAESTDGSSDIVPPAEKVAISRAGDLWLLGDHRLLQGNALDPKSYIRLLMQGICHLVLTDPPYNVPIGGFVTRRPHREFAMASGEMDEEAFAAFLQQWMALALTCLQDGGLILSFMDWRGLGCLLAVGRELELTLLNMIVWAKSNAGQGSLWRSQHELLPVFKLGTAPHVNNVALGKYGRWRSNVWTYPGGSSAGETRQMLRDHPTPKNREMIEDAILDVTNRGDVVLDPFVGSGTTLVAAETTGRQCRAMEIDGIYCDVTIRRWQALTGKEAILEETGETFVAVAARRAEGRERPSRRTIPVHKHLLALPKPGAGGANG